MAEEKVGEKMQSGNSPANLRSCRECLVGRCRLQSQTLLTWVQGDLITVPDFPVWVCDLCGWRSFDSQAIRWLQALLNPFGQRERAQDRRRMGDQKGTGTLHPSVSG